MAIRHAGHETLPDPLPDPPDLPISNRHGDIDDPLGDIDREDFYDDKGQGLESIPISVLPDPRYTWRLVPTETINRVAKQLDTEIEGEVAGYRSTYAIPYGESVRLVGKCSWIEYYQNHYYFVYQIAVGPISDVSKAFLDGVEVTLTASTIKTGRFDGTHPDNDGWVHVYDGNQDEVDSFLGPIPITGDPANYVATHAGYVYAVYKRSKYFVNGLPSLEILVDGLEVYDPRGGGSTAVSSNPVLCAADLATNTTYGAGDSVTYDSAFEAAADYCDDTFGGEKRYEIAIALQRPAPVPDWLGTFSAYGSFIIDGQGGDLKFVSDQPRDPIAHFGDGKLVEGSTRWVKDSGFTRPDDIEVEWEDENRQPKGPVAAKDPDENAGTVLVDFLRMPGFRAHGQAKRYAQQRLAQQTVRDMVYHCEVTQEGIELSLGDVITITDRRWRISRKPFIVVGVTAPGLTYKLELIEYQDSAYPTLTDPDPDNPDVDLPNPFDFPASLSAFAATRTYTISSEGDVNHIIEWEIYNPTDYPYVTGYRIQAGIFHPTVGNVEWDFVQPVGNLTGGVIDSQAEYTKARLITPNYLSGVLDCYISIITPLTPVNGIDDTDSAANGGGLDDPDNGVYSKFFGMEDDPTPAVPTDVQANEIANNVAGVAGVWCAWQYDNRPNYHRRFYVRVYNITQASYESTTKTTSSRHVLLSSSGWNSTSDDYRIEVQAENRSNDFSTAAQSAAFKVSTVA